MLLHFYAIIALLPVISFADRGCPGGWIHYSNKCYHFSHDDESMPVAVLICQHLGGVLTEVEGSAKNDFLTKQANMTKPLFNYLTLDTVGLEAPKPCPSSTSSTKPKNYWIALSDIQEEGIWRWYHSNTELSSSSVVDWAPDQPDNNRGQQNCAFIRAAGHWADGACASYKRFICEKADVGISVIG